jgi:hypothetical protein
MDKRIESSNRDKVLRRVARGLRVAGLARTKTTFFTRCGEHVIEFVHLHKFTFAPSFRVHLGIRVLNDTFDARALNGPDEARGFEFGSTEESVSACADCVIAYVDSVAEPWFRSWRDLDRLLSAPDTPLRADTRQCLRDSLDSGADPVRARQSHDLLGTAQHS